MRAPDACQSVARHAGPVDILINNAGDVPSGGVLEIDEDRWRKAWDLKVFGYINLTREIYREMVAAGRGVIVNIVGTAGERPRGNHIAVASGNAALIAFSRALGLESVSHGVRVVAVNPGAVGDRPPDGPLEGEGGRAARRRRAVARAGRRLSLRPAGAAGGDRRGRDLRGVRARLLHVRRRRSPSTRAAITDPPMRCSTEAIRVGLVQ